MIRKLALIGVFLCLGFCFFGCAGGTGSFKQLRGPEERQATAKTFNLEQIIRKAGIADSVQDTVVTVLRREMITAFQKKGLTASETNPDLKVKVIIEDIKPGDAGLRYLGGIWAAMGKGTVLVLIKALDGQDHELFSGEAEGTVTGGKWGGHITDACKRIAEAYVGEYFHPGSSAARNSAPHH